MKHLKAGALALACFAVLSLGACADSKASMDELLGLIGMGPSQTKGGKRNGLVGDKCQYDDTLSTYDASSCKFDN